jgi:glycosyltransferase involved in cell wall biosynthesis
MARTMASISVCIPTFNRKAYLKEAIKSVLAQTHKDYEIVIVDDGSTDGTEQMLKDAGYPIRYYWQQNSGDAAARNRLIQLAHGRYITFLDSDDILMPNAVEQMMTVIDRESEDVIVYGPYIAIDDRGNVCKRKRKRLYSGRITRYLFESILVHSCGSMFPKRVLEQAGGFDTSLPVCSDYDLWLRLSMKYRFIALPVPTFKRRRHSGNLSTHTMANRVTELRVLERFYYEKGGSKVAPERIAFRRLSKEAYRAGKSALGERDYEAARSLLEKSVRWRPSIKSLFCWLRAILAERYRRP